MEDKHPIDKKFEDLRDHQVAAPEFVWENVQAALPKQKRRPKGAFWWTGGMLLLAAFALYITTSQSNSGLSKKDTAQATTALELEDQSATSSSTTTSTTVQDIPQGESSVANIDILQDKNTTSDLASIVKSSNLGNLKSVQEPTLKAPKYAKPNIGLLKKLGEAAEFFEKKGIEKTPQASLIEAETSTKTESSTDFSKSNNKTQATDNQNFTLTKLHKRSLQTVELLSHSSAFMAADKVRMNRKTFPQTKRSYNCFDFSEVGSVLALEAYAGPAFGFRNWTLNDDSQQAWLNDRLEHEKNRFAWTAGVNATLLTKRTLVLRAGLQLTQQNEVFKQDDPLYVRTTIETLTLPDGTTTSDTSQEIGFRHVRTDNRLTMIDLPVSVGYELRKGRKGMSLYAGAAANLYFHKKGEFLDNEGERFDFGADKTYFKTNVGLSVHGGAQFFYTLRPSVRIFAEPYVKHILSPLTADNQAIAQNYTFFGVKFGVAKAIY